MSIKLDSLQTFIVVQDPATIKLDSLQAFIVVQDPIINPYTGDPLTDITKAINASHGVTFRKEDIILGDATSYPGSGFYNAEVDITFLPSSSYSGTMKFKYERLDIDDIISGRDLSLFTINPAWETTHDLLTGFNTRYGTTIPLTEVILEPISGTGMLTAAAGSYYFNSGSRVYLNTAPTMEDAFPVAELAGFDIPT